MGTPAHDVEAAGFESAWVAETSRSAFVQAAVAVAGRPQECRRRIAAFEAVADRVILGGAWAGRSPGRLARNHRAMVETFCRRR